jgi:hypothetical protein
VADAKLVQWYSGATVHSKELCVHAALELKLLVRFCRHKYKKKQLTLFTEKADWCTSIRFNGSSLR